MGAIRTGLLACLLGVAVYVYLEPIPDAIEIPLRLKTNTHLNRLVSPFAQLQNSLVWMIMNHFIIFVA